MFNCFNLRIEKMFASFFLPVYFSLEDICQINKILYVCMYIKRNIFFMYEYNYQLLSKTRIVNQVIT